MQSEECTIYLMLAQDNKAFYISHYRPITELEIC